jgi:cadmium resistance protein CadD (predicted permease)
MTIEIAKFLLKMIITFLLTNIQDIVILINFFLEASEDGSLLKNDHVVLGQFLGFSTLLMLSLIGYTISYVLPVKIFGFLGFLIIFFGLNGFKKLFQDLRKKKKDIQQIAENEQVEFIELETVDYFLSSKLIRHFIY